jgi:hypothetical protein
MSVRRKLAKVYTPPVHPGFLGKGHTARPVIQIDFSESDPFIMLMDDWLQKTDSVPVGGPHPHAGFETVSLLLQGEIGMPPHVMKAGDFEMMTAGSGVVHTETISKPTNMRLLQLWLNLPKHERHALPRIQKLVNEHVPTALSDNVTIKVYSGSFGGVSSPIQNYTPLIIADVEMKPGTFIVEHLPSNFNTFLYVMEGTVLVGEQEAALAKDEVGWLDLYKETEASELMLKTGKKGARFVLYAALPQHHEIVSHGPFIADSMDDIRQLYSDFKHGKMEHISEVSEEQKLLF